MDLNTPLDTLCRLILRAKVLEAQVASSDTDQHADDVDHYDDKGDQVVSMFDDVINDGVEEEVQALLENLTDNHLAETLALAWVGAGTYHAGEWGEAVTEASGLGVEQRLIELLDMPLLGGHLEAGLAAFDYDCDGFGRRG